MISSERLKLYCNQSVSYEEKNTVDRYGHETYKAAVTIKVRKEGKSKIVRDADGHDVVSTTTIFSPREIKPCDKVDGMIVINSSAMVRKDGSVIGWECYI